MYFVDKRWSQLQINVKKFCRWQRHSTDDRSRNNFIPKGILKRNEKHIETLQNDIWRFLHLLDTIFEHKLP